MQKSELLNIRWQPGRKVNRQHVPHELRPVLFNRGSLTDRLEQCCPGSFNLQLLQQKWQRPLPDERIALSLADGRYAMVREILLQCEYTPLVYGRSIIPTGMFKGSERRLAYLGERSLGDYLFSRKDVTRDTLEIARIPRTALLHQLARHYASNDQVQDLWARRSIFRVNNKPLLVVEIFLPGMTQCKNNK